MMKTRPKLQEAIDLFLAEKKPTTAESYFYSLRELASYLGTKRPLHEIDEADLLRYMQTLRDRNNAPATFGKHVKTIKTFLNWCERTFNVWRGRPPQRAMKMPRLRTGIDPDRAMTDEEFEKLLERHRYDTRIYALLLFFADTACRAGGGAGLKVEDLDLTNNEASIIEKGDKARKVAYGDACKRALQHWLIEKHPDSYPYVFRHNKSNKPLHPDNISQLIRRACIRAGVRSLGSHSLRHRKGFQLSDSRISPTIAAVAMGHEDEKTTLAHYYPRDWARAKDALMELSTPDNREEKPAKIIPFDKSRKAT